MMHVGDRFGNIYVSLMVFVNRSANCLSLNYKEADLQCHINCA